MTMTNLFTAFLLRRRRRAATERLRKITERARTPTATMRKWGIR